MQLQTRICISLAVALLYYTLRPMFREREGETRMSRLSYASIAACAMYFLLLSFPPKQATTPMPRAGGDYTVSQHYKRVPEMDFSTLRPPSDLSIPSITYSACSSEAPSLFSGDGNSASGSLLSVFSNDN